MYTLCYASFYKVFGNFGTNDTVTVFLLQTTCKVSSGMLSLYSFTHPFAKSTHRCVTAKLADLDNYCGARCSVRFVELEIVPEAVQVTQRACCP